MTITQQDGALELRRLEAAPKPLDRPVVILNGYHGLPRVISSLTSNLRNATSGRDEDFLAVSFFFSASVESAAAAAVDEVNERWPSVDPDSTVEVDVVALSMGGIVARWAALTPEQRAAGAKSPDGTVQTPMRRLRIRRLYTLSSPHRGAAMAEYIRIDQAAVEMRAGSEFLHGLDAALPAADYELVCYSQLRDMTVGATRAAPDGRPLTWTGGTLLFSHLTITDNTVVLADIARRLRNEPPLVEPGDPPAQD